LVEKKDIYILSDRKIDGVFNLPTFQINFISSKIDILKYDALIFTSKNGILSLNSFNDQWKQVPSYTISQKTAQQIDSCDGKLEFTGTKGYGDSFARELAPLLKNKKVLYVKAKEVVSRLTTILKEQGVLCDELTTYETVCKTYDKSFKPPKNSIIILSSPSTLNCFLDTFGWDYSYMAVSIGKTTSKFIPDYINYKTAKYRSLESCIKLAKTL
jgi:uroporphyrinogen-III synthase